MNLIYLILGAFYLAAFFFLATKRPKLAMAAILGAAPFNYNLFGGAVNISFAELHVFLLFLILVLAPRTRAGPFTVGPIIYPVSIYFLICIISSIHTLQSMPTLICMAQMTLYLFGAVMVFCSFPPRLQDLRFPLEVCVWVGAGLGLYSVISGSSYILGLHKNALGASLACSLTIGVTLFLVSEKTRKRRWLGLAMAMNSIGLIHTLSRGAWMSTAAALLVITAMMRNKGVFLRAIAVLVPVVCLAWIFLPDEQKEFAMGFEAERGNIGARLVFIDSAMAHFRNNPMVGIGVTFRKESDSTNIVMSTLAETGVPGLIAFLLIHAVFFRQIWTAQKHLATNDQTYPYLVIGAALVAARLTHGLVDHYWSRGALLLAWAGAGMATRAVFETRTRFRLGAPRGERTMLTTRDGRLRQATSVRQPYPHVEEPPRPGPLV